MGSRAGRTRPTGRRRHLTHRSLAGVTMDKVAGPSWIVQGQSGYALYVSSRGERVGRNEAVAREINEGIESSLSEASAEGYVRMLCECSNSECEELIAILIQEYEGVRSDPRTF